MFDGRHLLCKAFSYNVGFWLIGSRYFCFLGREKPFPARLRCAPLPILRGHPATPHTSKDKTAFSYHCFKNSHRRRSFWLRPTATFLPASKIIPPSAVEASRHKLLEAMVLSASPMSAKPTGTLFRCLPLPRFRLRLAPTPPTILAETLFLFCAIRFFQQGQVHGQSPFVPILGFLASALHFRSGHLPVVVKDLHRWSVRSSWTTPPPLSLRLCSSGPSGLHPVLPVPSDGSTLRCHFASVEKIPSGLFFFRLETRFPFYVY